MRHLPGDLGPATCSARMVKDSPWLWRHLQGSLISVLLGFLSALQLEQPPTPPDKPGQGWGGHHALLSDRKVQRLRFGSCPRPHRCETAGQGLGTWFPTFKASTVLRANTTTASKQPW